MSDQSSADKFTDLRRRAQSLLAKQQNPIAAMPPEELSKLIEEFYTYQIELELQNEDLRQAQGELEKSRRKYCELYDSAPIGSVTLNDKGMITEANLTAANMLGIERRELVGKPLTNFIEPEDQDTYYIHFRSCLTSQKKKQCEFRLKAKDGRVFPVEFTSICHRNSAVDNGCIRAVMADISRLKAIEKELQNSEGKFRTIADFTYDWEYWIDPAGKLLYVSPSCERLTGFTVDEFMEDPGLIVSLAHPYDRQRVEHHIAEELQVHQAIHLDYRLTARDGAMKWVSHCCQSVYDSEGRFFGRRASVRNITKRKKLEKKLRDQQKLLRTALDASSDGVWDRDLVTNETFYGDNWYRALGYTRDELRNNNLDWNTLLHPEDKPKTLQAIQDHLSGKTKVYEAEFRMRDKSGDWKWFLSRGKVLAYDDNGEPLRLVGTHRDITTRKHFEFALQQATHEQEAKVRERTRELEETNIALNVLLRKRTQDKSTLEMQILDTIGVLVDPYFSKLEQSGLTPYQQQLVTILRMNLREVTSSFENSLSSSLRNLTPVENQVANLVKMGKATKEIAELMNLSPGTISVHRKNIRKKLGLTKSKENLQTVLSSLFETD